MAVRKILLHPQDEARLRRKSTDMKRTDSQYRSLMRDLKETLLANPGAGLAAPQIGVLKRVTAVRFGQDEGEMQDPLILINPEIVERGPLVKGFDGCLSMPGLCTWDTLRPEWLVFTGRGEDWKPIKMRVEGIDARLVDHEIDHLDGKLFLDYLTPESKLYVARQDENGETKLVEIDRLLNRPRT
jgi:peptide deformylase